jgi:hypothetical protein
MVTVNGLLQFEHQRSPARVLAAGLALMSENLDLSLHWQCGQIMPPFHRTDWGLTKYALQQPVEDVFKFLSGIPEGGMALR